MKTERLEAGAKVMTGGKHDRIGRYGEALQDRETTRETETMTSIIRLRKIGA